MGTIPAVPVFPAGQAVQGTQLQLLASAIAWCFSQRPVTQLKQAAAQSITNNTATAVTWDTKIIDRDGGWSAAASTRYTAQTPGIYLAAASLIYPTSGTGDRQLWFRVTTGASNPSGPGVTTSFGFAAVAGASTQQTMPATSLLTPYLYVADYVEVLTLQNSGGALSLSNGISLGSPMFTIRQVSG